MYVDQDPTSAAQVIFKRQRDRVAAGRDDARSAQVEMAPRSLAIRPVADPGGAAVPLRGLLLDRPRGRRSGSFSARDVTAEHVLLVHVGECMSLHPGVRKAILAGEIALESAEQLRRILLVEDDPADPLPSRSDVNWFELARVASTADFRHLVEYHLALWKEGEPSVKLSMWVSQKGCAAFRRAKAVLRAKQERSVTDGETLETLAQAWLDDHDPYRRDLQVREGDIDDTSRETADPFDPASRYVPARIHRSLLRRDGWRCAVPNCSWDGDLHNGHLTDHALGGPRTRENQVRICPMHNYMMLSKLLVVEGDGDDPEFPQMPGKKHLPWIYDQRDYAKFRAWLAKHALLVKPEDLERRHLRGPPAAET